MVNGCTPVHMGVLLHNFCKNLLRGAAMYYYYYYAGTIMSLHQPSLTALDDHCIKYSHIFSESVEFTTHDGAII